MQPLGLPRLRVCVTPLPMVPTELACVQSPFIELRRLMLETLFEVGACLNRIACCCRVDAAALCWRRSCSRLSRRTHTKPVDGAARHARTPFAWFPEEDSSYSILAVP